MNTLFSTLSELLDYISTNLGLFIIVGFILWVALWIAEKLYLRIKQ